MKLVRTAAVLAACLAAGCSGSTTTTPASSTPTTAATPTGSEFFAGTLAVQGSTFFPFTITTAGTVTVTLNSLTTGTTMPVPGVVVGIGLGLPSADGTACVVSASGTTAVGLTSQLTGQGAVGTGCVKISDVGNLAPIGPVTFVLRVAHS